MVLLNLCLFLFAVAVIVFFLMQVLIPLFSGDPLFPWFRGSTAKEKLEAMEDKLEETLDVAAIQQRVQDLANKVSENLNVKK